MLEDEKRGLSHRRGGVTRLTARGTRPGVEIERDDHPAAAEAHTRRNQRNGIAQSESTAEVREEMEAENLKSGAEPAAKPAMPHRHKPGKGHE
jgi:hypothetical protein